MPLTHDKFRSARLKVHRANRHIDELRTELRSYSEGGGYGIDVHSKPDLSDSIVIMRPSKPIPDGLPLIIGDTVHNLRSAFDHVNAACRSNQGFSGRNIGYFPFRQTANEFMTDTKLMAHLDTIEAALPGARHIILNEIQPHENGKLGIYPINSLDGIDKHNELVLVTHATLVNAIKLIVDGTTIEIQDCWFHSEEPTTLYRGPGKPTVECDSKRPLRYDSTRFSLSGTNLFSQHSFSSRTPRRKRSIFWKISSFDCAAINALLSASPVS